MEGEHRQPKYDSHALKQLRRRHDAFVETQAARLGVEPADILQSVRDFGLTAEEIAAAEDASALTRHPSRNGSPSFKVLEFVPVKKVDAQSARHDVRREPYKARQPRTGHLRDAGGSTMADAIRKAGLRN